MAISLKAARVNAGYTLEAAAKALNTNIVSLVKYEQGKVFPKVTMAYKMAELYGLQINEIDFFRPSV